MSFAQSTVRKRNEKGATPESAMTITVAGDFGYSTAQLYGSTIDVNQPSYFLPVDLDQLPEQPEQGVFTYVAGDSIEMIGKSFVVGSMAHAIDASACRKNADAAENKVDNMLILLLGLLSYLSGLPEKLSLNLLTCLQKVTPELKREVVQRLRGTHEVKYGSRKLILTVNLLGCANEGLGVIACVPGVDATQDVVVISLGGGTTNVSQFKNGKLITQQPFDGGVMRLYEQLSLSPSVIERLKGQGDIHLIREGVERQDFFYGKPTSPARFSFRADYEQVLIAWMNTFLKRPLQYAKTLLLNADLGLVFGGGVKLFGVEPYLRSHGYQIARNPVKCNVQGLYKVAEALISKRGY